MNFSLYIPILVVVGSNAIYHVCSKSTPAGINSFAALTLAYLIAAASCFCLYFVTERGGNIIAEYKKANWACFLMGVAIIGLEYGYMWMYKVGWDISVGQLIQSAILAVVLVFVGFLAYHEQLTLQKIAGIVICLAGLYLIKR